LRRAIVKIQARRLLPSARGYARKSRQEGLLQAAPGVIRAPPSRAVECADGFQVLVEEGLERRQCLCHQVGSSNYRNVRG
jgi:hypothetical protein